VRSSREFSEDPLPGRVRVTAFGDSFTHCSDVGNDETWEERISELDPTFEVINFGVGGYALDQAHLRFLAEGDTYRGAAYVLVGFMSENIKRMVNVFRPFYHPDTGLPLPKPRYRLVEGKLELLPNPLRSPEDYRRLLAEPSKTLPSLGLNDHHFVHSPRAGALDFLASVRLVRLLLSRLGRKDGPTGLDGRYRERSRALDLLVEVMARFDSDVRATGAVPVIVLFPNGQALARFLDADLRLYGPLVERLRERGIHPVDLLDDLAEACRERPMSEVCRTHCTAEGNRVIARTILRRLKAMEDERRRKDSD
jgi:hypothetical protein